MSTGATIVLIVVVVAVVLAAGWFVAERMRSRNLRSRFGPEYDRRVAETDDRRAAERELAERRKRHAALDLRPLSEASRTRYAEQWTMVQERFVDQPREAVVEADALVVAVLRERGYPTDGFDQQAADLSVEHAAAVEHYRGGHDIRLRLERSEVSTEELRRALVHYREVFGSVAGLGAGPQADTARRYDDAAR
ncbi:hypothetical protein [Actinophytocola gossypii]|uniref:Secreted protein n=1 Tax=Actinophytocola gossypii TaxID=2812003 RepID=A0ABT2J6D5_9PSEU|nr:hypothetical protein [Actinophytocola gossypii]MCT2583427.1 hypothetical protein [Actinophytocola gossypii]